MTLTLFIGNRNYSSWSLRGWLACKQSGLPFETETVSLYDEAWAERRKGAEFAPSHGKVPILWDGAIAVWDSLAIVEYLNDKTGNTRFWPASEAARALARSMATEMHAGFNALRNAHSMNIRQTYPPSPPGADVSADIDRITELWAEARKRFGAGGDFLFGEFGAADILFAPVVTRLITYALPMSPLARVYADAVIAHPFMREWIEGARAEDWVIERFEGPVQAA